MDKEWEVEATTKNCRSCRNFGSHHGICEICKDNKCWTEKEPTADNDSADDCISRQAVLEQAYAYGNGLEHDGYCVNVEDIQSLPSVTPQEPIDYKTQYENYLKKSEVVISQLRADRDRLQDAFDKLRAEIEQTVSRYSISRERGGMGQVEWSDSLIKESEVLKIIDKYKAEIEPQDNEKLIEQIDKIKNDMADIGEELRTRFDKYKADRSVEDGND